MILYINLKIPHQYNALIYSDAEESELRSNNKFRSEDDSFDVVSEQVGLIFFFFRAHSTIQD